MNTKQQGQEGLTTRDMVNLVLIVPMGWAWCLYPFLRINMGKSAIGMRGVLALGVIWVYGATAPCPEMVPFFVAWLAFVIMQRLRTAWLMGQYANIHSKYAGDPLVMKLCPLIKRVSTAKAVEFILCIVGGGMLCGVSQTLGAFVMIGGFCMALVMCIDQQIITNRATAMKDAEIEQRFMADLHRGRRVDY